MSKALDLTNQQFNLLTAIKRAPSRNGHTYWVCKCKCGNEKEVQTAHLTSGAVKSCGCLQQIMLGNAQVDKNFTPEEKQCPICQNKFLSKQRNRKYCYDCIPEGLSDKERQKAKLKAFKHYLVMYKGGQCEICGYNKCEGALEFHHINPEEKEIEISKWDINYSSDIKDILKELDKCLLLCANCHREQHYLNNN